MSNSNNTAAHPHPSLGAGGTDDVDDYTIVAAAAAAAAAEDEAAAAAAIAANTADQAPPTNPHALSGTGGAAGVVVDAAAGSDGVDPYSKWNKNAFGVAVAKQSGKFSKEESDLVRKAVEEFCAAKQISTARLCSECDHKAELKGAWMEIAKRIPHRSVQSVYRHGIRRLHPFKRGTWSEAECAMLVELVTRLGKKWSTIQGKLNRSADSCRDKYREMSDDFVKGRWKEAETDQLKDLIRDAVGLGSNSDMDMKAVAKLVEEQGIQIPWSSISKRMGKRSRLSCFKKWQKMTGASGEDDGFDDTHEAAKRKAVNDRITAAATADAHKRLKLESGASGRAVVAAATYQQAPTAGAAAALAVAEGGAAVAGTGVAAGTAAAGDNANASSSYEDVYSSAKMADATVEAVGLPDARASFV